MYCSLKTSQFAVFSSTRHSHLDLVIDSYFVPANIDTILRNKGTGIEVVIQSLFRLIPCFSLATITVHTSNILDFSPSFSR
jgi:hypothetical protein